MKYLVITPYEFPEGAKGDAMRKFMPGMIGSLNLGWRAQCKDGAYFTVRWGNCRPEKLDATITELRAAGHEFEVEDLR